MIRKLFLTTAAAVVMMALSAVAHADTVTLTSIGGTGVDATITNYTLVGNRFCFTINNTSTEPGSTGTITSLGFDLPGSRANNFVLVDATNTNFVIAYDVNAQAGAQNFTSTFDLALLTGPNFGGGKVAEGIAPGQSATFCIEGDFTGLTAQQIAEAIFARFQAVNGDDSDVAHSNGGPPPPPDAIPEPTTMLLLGTGLAGAAASARRRRKAAQNDQE